MRLATRDSGRERRREKGEARIVSVSVSVVSVSTSISVPNRGEDCTSLGCGSSGFCRNTENTVGMRGGGGRAGGEG